MWSVKGGAMGIHFCASFVEEFLFPTNGSGRALDAHEEAGAEDDECWNKKHTEVDEKEK